MYVSHHLQDIDKLLDTMGTCHLVMNLVMLVSLDLLNCYWTLFLSKGKQSYFMLITKPFTDYYRRLTETRPKTTQNGELKTD